jgi:hypothetical protein
MAAEAAKPPVRLDIGTLAARCALPPASVSGADDGLARDLAAILDQLGWRSASDVPASAVAPEIAMMVGACVRGHRDIVRLRRGIAECLRRHSHPLDGSGTSVAAWEPFAAQLLGRLVAQPARTAQRDDGQHVAGGES